MKTIRVVMLAVLLAACGQREAPVTEKPVAVQQTDTVSTASVPVAPSTGTPETPPAFGVKVMAPDAQETAPAAPQARAQALGLLTAAQAAPAPAAKRRAVRSVTTEAVTTTATGGPNLRIAWRRTTREDVDDKGKKIVTPPTAYVFTRETLTLRCQHGTEKWDKKLTRFSGTLADVNVVCVMPRGGPLQAWVIRADGTQLNLDQPEVMGFEGTADAVGIK